MTFRPDIVDSNWGGFDGKTCGAESQTLTIDLVENGNRALRFVLSKSELFFVN